MWWLNAANAIQRRLPIFPGAVAAAVIGSCLAGAAVKAQSGSQETPTHVRLAEIARHEIFLPLYGALNKGFFRHQGLDVAHNITLGPDRTLAALLNGEADVALGGPDLAILSAIAAQDEKVKIIAGLSRFDGSFLVARNKIATDRFRWASIKGRPLMGWRSGSLPAVFLESALRTQHIEPRSDIDYRPDIPFPLRMRTWRDGRVDFATFYLTDAARLERNGEGYAVASIGAATGPSVYAVFLASTKYVRGHPDTIQKWVNAIQAALRWTADAPLDDLVSTAAKYLSRAAPADLTSAIRRYRPLDMWQTDPTVGRDAIDKVQTMMIQSDIMAPDKRVKYETVVEPRFAENAKRAQR